MIICYFGDSLTLGYGDPSGLGWPGRVSGALCTQGLDVTSYNLGVRKDASVLMQERWRSEAALRRMEGQDFKLVFSFGAADVINAVPADDTVAAAEAMLSEARAMGDVILVGPTPVLDESKREGIAALSARLEDVCRRLNVPFIPVAETMADSSVYMQALEDGDTVHPAPLGYATLAEHIFTTNQARTFFGLE